MKIRRLLNLFVAASALLFFFEGRAGELFPQSFKVKIKELKTADAAGGKIEIQISSNGKLIFSSEEQVQSGNKGPIAVNRDFNLVYLPGDMLSVKLVRKGRFFNKTLLSKTSSSSDAVREIFSSAPESGGASLSFELLYPEGTYKVKIGKSFIAPRDFIAAGGLPKLNKYEETGKMVLEPYDGMKQYLKGKLSDSVQQRIRISQNDRIIFDSAKQIKPLGQSAEWNLFFNMYWKRGDRIGVVFSDCDFPMDDIIFSRMSDTETSIGILNGILRGGAENRSFIAFGISYP